jgi:hypothetical protein
MSKDFSIGNQPVPYKGQVYASPIRYTTPPADIRAVRVDIDWIDYGVSSLVSRATVSLNLIAAAVQTPLDAIRSVYIDNTFSNVAVYVQFPDTKFTIVCPPNSVVMSPAFTNVQEAIVYAEGFRSGDIPATKLHFSSANAAGFIVPSTGRQALLLFPQILTLNSTPGTSYNFNNMPMGAPQDRRLIVLVVTGYRAAAGSALVSAALIGGYTATVLNLVQKTSAPSASMALIYALVPVGAIQNVGISWNAVMDGCYLGVYTIYNQTKDAPYFVTGASDPTAQQLNMTVDAPQGSAAIFASFQNGLVPTVWTNTDEDGIELGAANSVSTASNVSASSGTHGVSANPSNAVIGAIFI